jgi:RNA-directed DNA polymerase
MGSQVRVRHVPKELSEINRDTLLRLLRIIVFHDCTSSYVFKGDRALLEKIPPHKTLFKTGPDKGLPIGNLTSQFFANVYLNELDHFVKHTLRCRFYLRYVDDFILLDRSAEQLLAWRGQIADFLREKLCLACKADSAPRRVTEGSDFLGYIVRPNYILVRRRVVNNLKAKLAGFRKKMVSELCIGGQQAVKIRLHLETVVQLRQIIASYLGHFRHADAYTLTKAVFEKHDWLNMIFALHNGTIFERLKYKGCVRSLKVQLFFYRDRLRACILLFQVGGFVELYGRDALFAGQYLSCRVRRGFRNMEYAAGFPMRLIEKVMQKIVSLGRSCAFIAQGGDGRYVKNRYVREVVLVKEGGKG